MRFNVVTLAFSVPELNLSMPELNLSVPELNMSVPVLNMSVPELNLSVPELRMSAALLNMSAGVLKVTVAPVSAAVAFFLRTGKGRVRYAAGMSDRTATVQPDWTTGPAKWAAVGLLAGASMIGTAWSVYHHSPPALSDGSVAALPFLRVPDAGPGAGGASGSPEKAAAPDDTSRRPFAEGVGRINLNTATAAELELLPGIGPTAARRIIDHRTASGPFRRLEDLDGVKGIGPRTLEKLRELVTVD